jgi:hypothetical protein
MKRYLKRLKAPGLRWLVLGCGLVSATMGRESELQAGPPPFYFVAGEITPEHFDFHVVIPHTGPESEPGGWQEACVRARMRNAQTGQSAICDFQPGMPIVSKKGRIVVRDAKVVVARAANRAARTILGGGTPPGIACAPFRELMAKLMRQDDQIPGATVKKCDGRVPPVYFDPER